VSEVPSVVTRAAGLFGLDVSALRDLGGASGASWGAGDRVLRLGLRAGIEHELAAMAAASAVLPVPEAHGHVEFGDWAAVLLGVLPGRTALEVATRHPGMGRDIGLACGALHGVLAGVAAPPGLGHAGRDTAAAVLLHLDLHPLNVLVTDEGGVTGVLDWANTAAGDPALDRARTWTILELDPLARSLRAEPGLGSLAAGWTEAARLDQIPAWARAWACRFMLNDLGRRYEPDELAHVREALAAADAAAGDEPLSLRRAAGQDAGDLRALAVAAYSHYIPRIGRPPAPMTTDYDKAVREDEVWVAAAGGAISGMIVLTRQPDHLLVQNLAVAPSAQGRGVGSRLLSLAEERAREYGVPELRLYTNEAMTENIAYYPRRGYTETHRDEQHGFRRVFFTKPVQALAADPVSRLSLPDDPEHRVTAGDRRELRQRRPAVHRNMRARTRDLRQVALQDRRALAQRQLHELAPAGGPVPQGHPAVRGAHVRHPVAVRAEHRDEVPVAVPVRHAEREAGGLTGPAAGHLEGHPASRGQAQGEDAGPRPRGPARRRVAATAGVHGSKPFIRNEHHGARLANMRLET
jgi:ribosomal protein S18 acetylase RimI-like enzyme